MFCIKKHIKNIKVTTTDCKKLSVVFRNEDWSVAQQL